MLVLAAVLVAAAAGCGGSSTDVASYLEAVEPEQERFAAIRDSVAEILEDVDTSRPGEAWTRAAEELLVARDSYEGAAAGLESIPPPPGLEDAHAKLVESVRISSRMTDQFASDLRSLDAAALAAATGVLSRLGLRVRVQRSRWKTAISAAAFESDVDIPDWVAAVGSTA